MRLRRSVEDAVMPVLGTTPARRAWLEASFEVLWEYGELSPFEAAMNAWEDGDMDLYEAALADDARLTELAEAAWGPQ